MIPFLRGKMDLEMSPDPSFSLEAEHEYQGKPTKQFFDRFPPEVEGDSEMFPIEIESSQSIRSP